MIVREFKPADVAAAVAVQEECGEAPQWSSAVWESLAGDVRGVEQKARLAVVAQEGARVAGFAVVFRTLDECEVETLAVAPAFRRRGLGRTLLRHALEAASEAGARRAQLEMRASNAAAKALYRSLGFSEDGQRKAYYRSPVEDATLLSAVLPLPPQPCRKGIILSMVRDGYLYGLALFVVAAVVWFATGFVSLTAIPVLLAAFFLWFFRDPSRTIPAGAGVIVSPGDGKVEEAEWIETTEGNRLRVTIFLNVFDVHVNRVPIGGLVSEVEYRKGQFLNAMRPDSAVHNEQTLITITDGALTVSFKQIAGLLARRIVCNLKAGDRVERGQRMGLIKFGSRVDVLMPASTELRVKVGQRVKGGSSILGIASASDGSV